MVHSLRLGSLLRGSLDLNWGGLDTLFANVFINIKSLNYRK